MEKKEHKKRNKAKSNGHAKRNIAIVIVIIIAIVAAYFIGESVATYRKEQLKTETESELIKVMKESKLYTAEYPYNGYTSVKDDKGNVKYYVAYNGTVKAGFDINKVKVNADVDNNVITVRLPKITILSSSVDTGSLEYIFENKKYETETVANEANRRANEDLAEKASSYKEIVNVGTENAKNIEKSLVESWVNYPGAKKRYQVRILTYEEAENDQTTSS